MAQEPSGRHGGGRERPLVQGGHGGRAAPAADGEEGLLWALRDDRAAFVEVLESLLADLPARLAEVRAAASTSDARGLRHAAHALKGSLGVATQGAALAAARELEALARRPALEGAAEWIARLEAETTALIRKLEAHR